jgi:hypothetical protein
MKGLDILGAMLARTGSTAITPRTPVKSPTRTMSLTTSTKPAPKQAVSPPPSPQAVSNAAGSASRLMAVAKRVASQHPKSKLGKTAQTAANNSLARIKKAQAAQSHMMGVDWGKVGTTTIDPSAWLATQAGTDDAFTAMVEAGGRALDLIDQLSTTGNQAAVDQGNAIVSAINDLLTAANAQLDPTGAAYASGAGTQFGGQAFALTQKENYWETSVTVKVPPGTTPPGTTPPGTTPPNANAPTIQTVIDAVSGVPNSGNPGDQVTLTGTNFTGTTAVAFGGVPAAFQVVSPTQISATVPANPAGSVTVTTPNGTATSLQTFTPASALNYGDAGGGGGGFGGGGGGFGGGGFDSGGGDDPSLEAMAAADQGGGDDGEPYVFDQSTLDRSVDQGGGYFDAAPLPPAAPMPAASAPVPTPTPVDVAKWASKDAYTAGDVVSYHNNYYRATKDVSSRWLFSNDAPDKSDAWTQMTVKKVADAQPDAAIGWSDWDWKTIFYDPAGGLYRYMNQDPDPVYQPRAVNTYWQNRAQSPIAASAASRLALAQQLQGSLQSQLAARYAALAAQAAQPQLVGEYGMSKKIIGPALCGFADYFSAALPRRVPLVGLAPVIQRGALAKLTGLVTHIPQKGSLSHGVTVKLSPAGHPISSLHINPKVLHRRDPEVVQHAAQLAAQHAQTVAKNVLNAVAHVATQQKKGGTAPAVHGVGAALRRPPTPHHVPPASLTQLKTQAQDLQKAASKLTSAAKTFKKQTDSAKSKQSSAISHQKTLTKLHGIIGADVNGLSPGQPGYDPTTDPTSPSYGGGYGPGASTSPPNPADPGYLMDGTPDPAYGGGGALPTSATSQVPGPPDYGAGPTPTVDTVSPQPEIDYVPSSDLGADESQFYTSDPSGALPNGSLGSPIPLGAIYFDGSRPLPFRGVANATCFMGTLPDGTVPKGGAYSGYEWHGSGGFDWALVLQGSGGGYSGGKNYDKVANPDMGMISESQKNGWGPLIGAPGVPGVDGLRFDVAKMAFFWPFDKAPDWAQAPVKQAAFNAAVVAWKAAQTAGQADYVAAQLQDKLDAQTAAANTRQQAQQDVGLAMQQQQFEQQQSQQSAALDLQSQQDEEAMAVQQAQLDAQQQAADIQAQQQQQQMDMQMQQFQMQQAAMAPPPTYADDGGGGFVDQGGGDQLDDGSDPEGASDAEAAAIDAGDSLVGASGAGVVDTYLRQQQLRDQGAVDGAGEVIGIDDYGNLTD